LSSEAGPRALEAGRRKGDSMACTSQHLRGFAYDLDA
jgi:hypothetical protein